MDSGKLKPFFNLGGLYRIKRDRALNRAVFKKHRVSRIFFYGYAFYLSISDIHFFADSRKPFFKKIHRLFLVAGELKEHLDQAILDLPQDFRIVLILRDQEGFSTRETAEILGISEPLAKVRLHRARLAMRKTLAGYLEQSS